MPDIGVSLLRTAKILIDKYTEDFPWDLIKEIALYETDDPDRKALKETVMRELMITIAPPLDDMDTPRIGVATYLPEDMRKRFGLTDPL
ncbi:hypothetical protein MMYC01_209945 [Madurella mycetomatis]|uniref:Uncharacterized protein n=1 Tax=Madurella mycetomatis TaxID=100816 RepID=A0A175VS42_9PEZI|nr:hypothetical protein MMYC01_209945 [Madurella mycetomatis]